TARANHTAVWTDSEMIVWGGIDNVGFTNTGGRYNPTTDTWTATSNTNAPVGREYHGTGWIGREKIGWGGLIEVGGPPPPPTRVNTGGRYCAQSVPPTPTPTGCSVTSTVCGRVIVGTAPMDFTVNLSAPADPATVQASDFTVNGTPADNDIIINGDVSITFHF